MRRYWQPVALSEEVPPGSAPLPVRLLSEDLVLFRDEHGRSACLSVNARIAAPISAMAASRTADCVASIMAGFSM